MAEAKKNRRTVVQENVNLTLSLEEAETLMAVGARIGGDSESSPRKHYVAVTEALRKAGVRDFTTLGDHPFKYLDRTGPGLYFKAKGELDLF
jgi:hypothetical protein